MARTVTCLSRPFIMWVELGHSWVFYLDIWVFYVSDTCGVVTYTDWKPFMASVEWRMGKEPRLRKTIG